MKNLANCTPREFLKQTVKIKRAVEKWLTVTDIIAIRKRGPELNDKMTADEKVNAIANKAVENLGAILEEIGEKHPDETLELLALLCFVEPAEVDEHPMEEYMKAINELVANEAVMGFFTSLAQLARVGTLMR